MISHESIMKKKERMQSKGVDMSRDFIALCFILFLLDQDQRGKWEKDKESQE